MSSENKMTITKKIEEKRDELAREFNSKEYGSKIDFKKGFNSACNLLLPEIEKLEEAIKSGAHYLTFHSQGKGATEFFQMNEDANKILKALQSWQEFLGEESEGGDE